jgi:aspartyl/glutamyl-tRNA(Asn/Gln) amidotransferase C subunit
MKKNIINIDATARLAKLSLSNSEKLQLEDELSRFAEFAQILSEYEPHALSQNTTEYDCLLVRQDTHTALRTSSAQTLIGQENVKDGYVAVPLTVEENK